MTKINKIIVVSILAFIFWSVGIFTIYKITWIPKRSITGVMIVKRPMKRTSSGKFVKMGFIEANASYLFLLTMVCAGAAGYAIKKIKKNREVGQNVKVCPLFSSNKARFHPIS